MDQKHKDLIKGNFPKLMEEIDFDLLLPELQHRNIITDATISKYQVSLHSIKFSSDIFNNYFFRRQTKELV